MVFIKVMRFFTIEISCISFQTAINITNVGSHIWDCQLHFTFTWKLQREESEDCLTLQIGNDIICNVGCAFKKYAKYLFLTCLRSNRAVHSEWPV